MATKTRANLIRFLAIFPVFIGILSIEIYHVYFKQYVQLPLNDGIIAIHHLPTKTITVNSTGTEKEKIFENRQGYGDQPQQKFITYKLIRNLPFNFGYGDIKMFTHYGSPCSGPDRGKFQAGALPGVLDFNTQIKTNLNIIYVGSSIAHQFAQGFEEACTPVKRQVTRFASNKRGWYQENVVSSLTPYNGTMSCLRITGLFLKNGMEKFHSLAPNGGGGWLSSDVRQLKQLAHQWRKVNSTNSALRNIPTACERDHGADDKNNAVPVQLNGTIDNQQEECEEKNFDVVVYQPPVEWVRDKRADEALSWDALHEAVELSFDHLGASTIILQTLPFQNNVKNINELVIANSRIWKYAMEFQANLTMKSALESTSKTNKDGKSASALLGRKILVMDIFSLSVASYLQNSIEIGIVGNETGKDLQSKLFSLESIDNPLHFLNLTMALSDSLQNYVIPHRKYFNRGPITKFPGGEILYSKMGIRCGDANCTTQSSISFDGLHWCMDQFAGRLNAGLACLTQCSLVVNKNSIGNFLGADGKTMSDCEKSCNAQFMTLDPVRWENGEETIVNGTTYVGLDNYRKQV